MAGQQGERHIEDEEEQKDSADAQADFAVLEGSSMPPPAGRARLAVDLPIHIGNDAISLVMKLSC